LVKSGIFRIKKMRILHGPHDYGGAGSRISRAQRKLGHRSDFAVFRPSFSRYPADFILKDENWGWSRTDKFFFLLKCLKDYDIFHLHSESIFAAEFRDISLLKKLGKKVIFHFHGSEIRGKEMHPRIRLADAHLVSTLDLLESVRDGIWIPQPIDLDYWQPLPVRKQKENLTIIHAPTSREVSGTNTLISTIEDLKKEGHKLELCIIEGKPYETLKEYYQNADIFVGKIAPRIGTYGNFDVEGMALKKPACVYMKQEYLSLYPSELPVVNTRPENIKQNLKMLIEDENLRNQIGEQGRAYVEKYHDLKRVALKCISIYQNC
jgi:glycosyltransferase involved in cell wall biosynthesis